MISRSTETRMVLNLVPLVNCMRNIIDWSFHTFSVTESGPNTAWYSTRDGLLRRQILRVQNLWEVCCSIPGQRNPQTWSLHYLALRSWPATGRHGVCAGFWFLDQHSQQQTAFVGTADVGCGFCNRTASSQDAKGAKIWCGLDCYWYTAGLDCVLEKSLWKEGSVGESFYEPSVGQLEPTVTGSQSDFSLSKWPRSGAGAALPLLQDDSMMYRLDVGHGFS